MKMYRNICVKEIGVASVKRPVGNVFSLDEKVHKNEIKALLINKYIIEVKE